MASNIKETGGYDVEFVDNEPNDVTCSICLFVLREPMQAENCGHRFCKSCIEDLKNSGNGTIVCPEDRNVIKVFKDNGKKREILNTLVKCSNNKDGCIFTTELRDLENHVEVCEFQKILCSIQGCQDQIQRRFVDSHKKDKHEKDQCTFENKLEQILQEMETKSRKMESLIEKIDSQNQKIESLNQKIGSQNQKIESQANEIVTLKQSLSEVKSSNQVFSDVYIWKIRNFARKFALAKQKRNNDPEVRRFFTSKGYKMVAEVYLNGFDDKWGQWLCVCFGLERGPFDNTLKWPMSAKITATDDSENYMDQLNTNKVPRSDRHKFNRPKDIDNCTAGTLGFNLIPIRELHGMVYNDTLTIKVTVSYN